MDWKDGLTGVALRIAATSNSPLRVMAGPGTGKSFAMKRRVARLLSEGAPPERILAVTFTRNAARSLVEDLRSLGVPGCDKIRASTLHAYCFGLLGGQDVFDFLNRKARPLVTFSDHGIIRFEAEMMLYDLGVRGFGGKRDLSKRVKAFEAAWARLQDEPPGLPTDPVDRHFHDELIQWLQFHECLLIGELVPLALRYLRDNPLCEARSAFDHVIVDEYQDLNRAEQDLIDLLAANGASSIVGDVDQSIYRFRHANPEGIETYDRTHVPTHDEQLLECRRCPKRVVALADSLIRINHPGSPHPRLNPKADNPEGHVSIVQWPTIREEAAGLADYIQWLIQEKGYKAGDILVLTPRRLLGYGIRNEVARRFILVHSYYHEEALESDRAQQGFALLSLLVDPEDRAALRWWLGHKSPSALARQYELLRAFCEKEGVSPSAALVGVANGTFKIPRITDLSKAYAKLAEALEELSGHSPSALIDELFPEGVADCEVLREAALLALEESETAEDLLDAVRRIATQPEAPENGAFVRVMSLHKSKGLTSKVVIVAGCLQGLIPTMNLDDTPEEQRASLLEQRRLFYVALTRCTEVLVLSSAMTLDKKLSYKIGARVSGYGNTVYSIPTQFMAELGPTAPQAVSYEDWIDDQYGLGE